MFKTAKSAADTIVKHIAQALPAWQDFSIEKTFPARAPYHPSLPANLASLPEAVVQRFPRSIPLPEHRIYQLNNVHVTWNGAVFHNLRVFVPSLIQPDYESGFQDTLLLRQWVGTRVEAPEVAVCHNQWSVENYYHWLVDTLPRLLVLRQTHPNIVLLLPQPLAPKQLPDYISRSVAVLGFKHFLPLRTTQILSASRVVLPEMTTPSMLFDPALVRQVRTELLAALSPATEPATRRVYAARSARGVRKIVNEAAVDAQLGELGFEKVYFENLTFLEQISLMRETAVFLGIHGAGMTNMMFLQDEAKVVELINGEHGALCYSMLASCFNLPYFCVPCQGTSEELGNHSDIEVDVPMLRAQVTSALA